MYLNRPPGARGLLPGNLSQLQLNFTVHTAASVTGNAVCVRKSSNFRTKTSARKTRPLEPAPPEALPSCTIELNQKNKKKKKKLYSRLEWKETSEKNTVHGRMLNNRCSEGSGRLCPLATADSSRSLWNASAGFPRRGRSEPPLETYTSTSEWCRALQGSVTLVEIGRNSGCPARVRDSCSPELQSRQGSSMPLPCCVGIVPQSGNCSTGWS